MTIDATVTHEFAVDPDWIKTPDPSWEERLRQFSPIVDHTSHLRFRYAGEGYWVLYQCIPKALLEPYRVEQLTVHWSELPPSRQAGRKVLCTEYQHYMFRTHGLDVRPFWLLQGPHGGTPESYTVREQAAAKFAGRPTQPPPLGVFPPCPFDERAVAAIMSRDALAKADGNLTKLAQQRSVAGQIAEDAEAEQEFRRQFVAWLTEHTMETADFANYLMSQPDADQHFTRITPDEARKFDTWEQDYLETGLVRSPGGILTSTLSLQDLL